MATQHTVKISNAVVCGMNLDDIGIRRALQFSEDSFKHRKGYYLFIGTLEEIERLASHMDRGSGWDLPAQTMVAMNRRAAQLRTYVAEQRAKGAV